MSTKTVAERLGRLERSNKLLLFLLTVAAALASIAAGQVELGRRAPVVEAEELRLLDPEGRVVAELRSGANASVGLYLRDPGGRERVALVWETEQAGLFVKDEAGNARIGIAQFAHGGGGVALHGEDMKGAAVLYLKGGGSLSFYDQEGAVTARLPDD